MDANLINPFIDATLHVLETMAATKAQAGKPFLKKDQTASGDVSGVIGLTGEASGMIAVSFSQGSILAIVSQMLGEDIKEMNEEIRDATGEIANMISGQARKKLEQMGRSLQAAIPTVIMGENHILTHVTKHPTIAVPFATDSGNFTIEVCFEE